MTVREKIAAVPKTLRYQGKVLTLSEELSDVQFFGSPNAPMAMHRVVFVDENNRPCFMSWIGKKTTLSTGHGLKRKTPRRMSSRPMKAIINAPYPCSSRGNGASKPNSKRF